MYKWGEENVIMGLIKRDCNAQEEGSMGKNTERESLFLNIIFYGKQNKNIKHAKCSQ